MRHKYCQEQDTNPGQRVGFGHIFCQRGVFVSYRDRALFTGARPLTDYRGHGIQSQTPSIHSWPPTLLLGLKWVSNRRFSALLSEGRGRKLNRRQRCFRRREPEIELREAVNLPIDPQNQSIDDIKSAYSASSVGVSSMAERIAEPSLKLIIIKSAFAAFKRPAAVASFVEGVFCVLHQLLPRNSAMVRSPRRWLRFPRGHHPRERKRLRHILGRLAWFFSSTKVVVTTFAASRKAQLANLHTVKRKTCLFQMGLELVFCSAS